MGLVTRQRTVNVVTCDECGRELHLDVEVEIFPAVLDRGWCFRHEEGQPDWFCCDQCLEAEYVVVEGP